MKLKLLIFLLCFVTGMMSQAQIRAENLKIGLAYGSGSQSKYPFNLSSYTHEVSFYKAQLNYTIKQKRKWAYEIHIEPSYNIAKHQLLNKWFIKEGDYEDYEQKRELFMQNRTVKEYVLNIGFALRYTIYKNLSAYAVGSVGPMISDRATERLAKGFAFSDVFGLGISYQIKRWQLGFRYSVRHVSNLEMKYPNSGHNTTNSTFSILYQLK